MIVNGIPPLSSSSSSPSDSSSSSSSSSQSTSTLNSKTSNAKIVTIFLNYLTNFPKISENHTLFAKWETKNAFGHKKRFETVIYVQKRLLTWIFVHIYQDFNSKNTPGQIKIYFPRNVFGYGNVSIFLLFFCRRNVSRLIFTDRKTLLDEFFCCRNVFGQHQKRF